MNDEGYSRCAAVLGSLLAAGGYSSTLAILASTLAILAAWRELLDLNSNWQLELPHRGRLTQRRKGAKQYPW